MQVAGAGRAPAPQEKDAMLSKLAGLVVLTASVVLCSSSFGSAYPRHPPHVRGASVHRVPAAPGHRRHGRLAHQGRSIAPNFLAWPPAFGYSRYEDLPPHLRPCFSLDDCDRKAFDESGTRGRMGLGADPAHPEGPGNVSD